MANQEYAVRNSITYGVGQKELQLNQNPQISFIIHDEKPTVVRQSLNALKEVVVFRPELCKMIEYELGKIDIFGYKDSMIPLIKKDIAELRELIEEKQEI